MSLVNMLNNALFVTFIIAIVNISSVYVTYSSDSAGLLYPVLAPPTNSRARVTETAKEYPVLLLLANNNIKRKQLRRDMELKPIYVERIEKRINPRHATF